MARTNKANEKIVAQRDKLTPSPEQRAMFIWNLLQRNDPKPTMWDMICFAGEILGTSALEHDWLKLPAKAVLKSIHIAHYLSNTPIDSCLSVSQTPTTDLNLEQELFISTE